MNFWIAIDKPQNISSANIVYKLRKLLNIKKIGHAGTLDPFATGVLPLAIGEATKSINYLVDQKKRYEFQVKFGIETDSDDIDGRILRISDLIPSEEDINRVIPNFIGHIEQLPPKFSAKKINGKRAYDLARQNEKFNLSICNINIEELDLINYDRKKSVAKFTIYCGKGTYIRAIARDMGKILGCYGHVISLRRTKIGIIDETSSISVEELEKIMHNNTLYNHIIPIELILANIPAVKIADQEILKIKNGCQIKLNNLDNGIIRILDDKGLIAIGEVENQIFASKRVFNNYIS